jgi:peptidoglycan/LPS O-acetylase OafA/YrhL
VSASQRPAHRPDVDGLRAIAVLAVIFFHAGAPGVWGGFAGVDVFFVISGFLITGILKHQLAEGSFSLMRFYERRVRRIFPGMVFLLGTVMAFASFTLLPLDIEKLGRSAVSAAFFVSNHHFLASSGYFAGAAHDQALLHTWSLAVEEQFYLVWPLMMLAAAKLGWRGSTWLLVGIVLSLGVSEGLVRHDVDAAYYLAVSRAWELGVGAWLAMTPISEVERKRWLAAPMALLGLVLIAYAVRSFNSMTAFPGVAALVPVLGAALVIRAGHESGTGNVVSRALGHAALTWVGQRSYALYLWHWPVMVFSRLVWFSEDGWTHVAVTVALSFLFAEISHRFIEGPLRQAWPQMAPARVVLIGLLPWGLIGVLAWTLSQGQGVRSDLDARERRLAAYVGYDGDAAYRGGSCFIVGQKGAFDVDRCLPAAADKPRLLLVGDSHAAHLWPGLEGVWGPQVQVLQATETGCRPLLKAPHGVPACRAFMQRMLGDWLTAHPVDVLVLAGRWSAVDLPYLQATLEAVQPHARQVVLVGPAPQYVTALPRVLVNTGGDPQAVRKALIDKLFPLDERMQAIAAGQGVRYESLLRTLCNGKACKTLARPDVPMQYDYGHFTVEGSIEAVRGLHLAGALSSAL